MPTLSGGDFSPLMATQCDSRFSGKATLALIVDEQGNAQNVQLVSSAENDADRLAVAVALLDHFSPALSGSKPVAASITLEMKVDACVIHKRGLNGQPTMSVRLRKPPLQELHSYGGFPTHMRYSHPTGLAGIKDDSEIRMIGQSISHPIPLFTPAAQFSDEGRRKGISGSCTITIIVDVHGLPQRPQIAKSLEASMDQEALVAANQYRFKPAMLDSVEPVAVRITVLVNFRLYSTPR